MEKIKGLYNADYMVPTMRIVSRNLTGLSKLSHYNPSSIFLNTCLYSLIYLRYYFSDLENMTRDSFDPVPPADLPVVVPINGKYEIKCFLPSGLPPPLLRSDRFSFISSLYFHHDGLQDNIFFPLYFFRSIQQWSLLYRYLCNHCLQSRGQCTGKSIINTASFLCQIGNEINPIISFPR